MGGAISKLPQFLNTHRISLHHSPRSTHYTRNVSEYKDSFLLILYREICMPITPGGSDRDASADSASLLLGMIFH